MKVENQKIDIIKLYTDWGNEKWNAYLTDCLNKQDLTSLENSYRGLQHGMSELTKQKLNTDKINVLFVRLQVSIEKTIKRIIKGKNKKIYDSSILSAERIRAKRKMDEEIEKYLKKLRY